MAAVWAQQEEKRVQEQLEKQAKIGRIATLENALEDDPEATPCPNSKWKLHHTKTFLEILVDESSKGSEEESQATDQDFNPPSGDDMVTESGCEIELDSPPKKKKKVNKEMVQAAIKVVRSSERTVKELPCGSCVSALAQGIINDGNGQIRAANVSR
jgi:hypothetical protein